MPLRPEVRLWRQERLHGMPLRLEVRLWRQERLHGMPLCHEVRLWRQERLHGMPLCLEVRLWRQERLHGMPWTGTALRCERDVPTFSLRVDFFSWPPACGCGTAVPCHHGQRIRSRAATVFGTARTRVRYERRLTGAMRARDCRQPHRDMGMTDAGYIHAHMREPAYSPF